MKKLSNTKAELKKKLLTKNACTTLTIGFNCPGGLWLNNQGVEFSTFLES